MQTFPLLTVKKPLNISLLILILITSCRMSELLDELSALNSKVMDLDVSLLDKKVDQMMPELGFGQDDNDRLVASYR